MGTLFVAVFLVKEADQIFARFGGDIVGEELHGDGAQLAECGDEGDGERVAVRVGHVLTRPVGDLAQAEQVVKGVRRRSEMGQVAALDQSRREVDHFRLLARIQLARREKLAQRDQKTL